MKKTPLLLMLLSVIILHQSCAQDKAPGLFPFIKDSKWGYINDKGEVMIPAQFEQAGPFNNEYALIVSGERIGFIDRKGKTVIEPKFDATWGFYEDMASVIVSGDQWGFIDKGGKVVIEPAYAVASRFSDGMARVKQGTSLFHQFGYIDKTGNLSINPAYENAGDFSEGLALVEIGGNYGYIDKTGKTVIEPVYEYGAIEKLNDVPYLREGAFKEGLAAVKKGDKYGYIDKTGKMIIEPAYDAAGQFAEGLAPVYIDGKYGYIDKNGKIVIKPQFDLAESFSEGLAAVMTGGLFEGSWGFIDKTGKLVIPAKYQVSGFNFEPLQFKNGAVMVYLDDTRWGYLDKTGKLFWKNEYSGKHLRMSLQKKFIPVLVVFVLLFIFMPLRFYAAFDMAYWENWTVYIFEHSILNVYNSDTNYPPFFLYFLYLFGLLQGSVESIKINIALIKYIPLVFDLIPFAVLYFLYKKNYLGGNIHYYLLFNIAYFYNSMVWGQVDGIHSNLCLLSFLAAFQSPAASVILFTLALNTKMQAIIFAPVLAAVLLTQLKSLRHLLQLSAAVLVTELIITLPYILSGNFSNYINVYLTSVDHQPKVSLNACNLWYLIFWNANPKEIFDGTPWLILSYKQVGLLLFALSSAFSILPLLLKSVTAFYEKKLPGNYYSLLFLTAGMISISFFYFNTQMHERYIHPAVICLFFYAAWSGNYVLYVLVSIAYLLGMEKVLDFFRLQELFHEPWFMDRRFIAILFSLALADGYRRIWLTYPSGQERQAFRSLISN